jgi:hypothetical protein
MNEDGTGYFKNNFFQQVKTHRLQRSNSLLHQYLKLKVAGRMVKYYLLINGVEPGRIVKITNPSNSKTVYAKVLYSMDKIR